MTKREEIKVEKLKAENEILKNMIECIKEELSRDLNKDNHEVFRAIGAITAISNRFNDCMYYYENFNMVLDYRKNIELEKV